MKVSVRWYAATNADKRTVEALMAYVDDTIGNATVHSKVSYNTTKGTVTYTMTVKEDFLSGGGQFSELTSIYKFLCDCESDIEFDLIGNSKYGYYNSNVGWVVYTGNGQALFTDRKVTGHQSKTDNPLPKPKTEEEKSIANLVLVMEEEPLQVDAS